MKISILKTVMVMTLACSLFGSASAQRFYDNKILQIVVPYGKNGDTTEFAKAVRTFLREYLGNRADFDMVYDPGENGIIGANNFAARADVSGLEVLVSNRSNALPYVLANSAVAYEFNDYIPLVGAQSGGVVYVSQEAGISEAGQLCDAGGLLIFGGVSTSSFDIIPLIAFDLLGLAPYNILGYDSNKASREGLMLGETNMDFESTSSFNNNVLPQVQATPLFTLGVLNSSGQLERDPVFPRLPTFQEVYRACKGTEPSGAAWEAYKATLAASYSLKRIIWIHKDAPPEAIAELQAALSSMLADRAFRDVKIEQSGEYDFLIGEDVAGVIAAALHVSNEARAYLDGIQNR